MKKHNRIRFYKKDSYVNKGVFYFFPAIILAIDMPFYTEQHNFAIIFKWLGFNSRLVFAIEEQE